MWNDISLEKALLAYVLLTAGMILAGLLLFYLIVLLPTQKQRGKGKLLHPDFKKVLRKEA